MAQTRIVCRFETDLVHDAVDTLLRVHQALTHRHGERFRSLERRVEEVFEQDARGSSIGVASLDGGVVLLTPPLAWRALITEARTMGVI